MTEKETISTAEVVIYVTMNCPYCIMAKQLLERKKVSYHVIDVSGNDTLRQELVEKSGGRRTVPQIFINGNCIGGYSDMESLNKEGKLDVLLGRA